MDRRKQMSIGYSITNIIEAKYYSRKDTIEKKVRLFDNLTVSGNYNFAADSFQWSNILCQEIQIFLKDFLILISEPHTALINMMKMIKLLNRLYGTVVRYFQSLEI